MMLFLVQAKLAKPAGMSNKEFYGVWEKEAEAVVAALKAGEIKTLYKVPGTLVWVQRALMECES